MIRVIAHGPVVNRVTSTCGVLTCPTLFRSGINAPAFIMASIRLLFSFVKNRVYKIDD